VVVIVACAASLEAAFADAAISRVQKDLRGLIMDINEIREERKQLEVEMTNALTPLLIKFQRITGISVDEAYIDFIDIHERGLKVPPSALIRVRVVLESI